jgi:hypothetical protein
MRLNCEYAFSNYLDVMGRGYITMNDLREFLKRCALFPVERDLCLLFERLDKDEDGVVGL